MSDVQSLAAERELDLHEALVMEKRGNVALANSEVIKARRLFKIADALHALPRRRHDG